MERTIIAIITVDDETAFRETGDGPIAYVEKEFGWLEKSDIRLKDCFIADDDESDEWKAYLNYLAEWAFGHQYEECKGMTPASFEEWRDDREYTEVD